MGATRRLVVCAYLADGAQYLLLSAALWKAVALGGSSLVLGVVPACSHLMYTASAITMGRRSDRLAGARLGQARAGALLVGVAAVSCIAAPDLTWLTLAVIPVGLGLGAFWPAVMATVAELNPVHPGASLARFNIAWSLGKASGYAAAGVSIRAIGIEPTLGLSALLALVLMWIVPVRSARHALAALDPTTVSNPAAERSSSGRRAGAGQSAASVMPEPREARRHRRMGWALNAIGFGVAAVVGSQYPKWLAGHDLSEVRYGIVLATLTGMQSVAFFVLGRTQGWQWRRVPTLVVLGAAGLAVPLLVASSGLVVGLVGAIIIGFGIGVAYHASLYYSVVAAEGRGSYAGMHEATLAAAALALPVLAGALADGTGWLEAPYVLGGGLLVAVVAIAVVVMRPRPATD